MESNLNTNFNETIKLYEHETTHQELIEMLETGSEIQKHVALLRLNYIENEEEAALLVSNLTGQKSELREAAAFRLNEFLQNPDFFKFFKDEKLYDVFLDAIIDINGNVCRNIISAISNLKQNPNFIDYFCQKLGQLTLGYAEKVSLFDLAEGKYKVNKEVFKLYWLLETVSKFSEFIEISMTKDIIFKAKNINDYTIREKIAKILTKITLDNDLLKAQQELKNDPNFYVRRI